MKKLTCCFTGHRIIYTDDLNTIKTDLYNTVESLIKEGLIYFGVGGALGFDMYAAQAVIELKKIYESVRLVMVLPCRDYDKYWTRAQKDCYLKIRENCDKIIYTNDEYYQGCMQKRNRHLVEHSSVCVAYIRKNTGGTAYTVKYAEKCGLKVICV